MKAATKTLSYPAARPALRHPLSAGDPHGRQEVRVGEEPRAPAPEAVSQTIPDDRRCTWERAAGTLIGRPRVARER
jgi:hypothetical protein